MSYDDVASQRKRERANVQRRLDAMAREHNANDAATIKPRNKQERLLVKGIKDTNERKRILTAERNRQRTRRINPNGTDNLRYGVYVTVGQRKQYVSESVCETTLLLALAEQEQLNRNNQAERAILQDDLTRTRDLLAERNAELRKLR